MWGYDPDVECDLLLLMNIFLCVMVLLLDMYMN